MGFVIKKIGSLDCINTTNFMWMIIVIMISFLLWIKFYFEVIE